MTGPRYRCHTCAAEFKAWAPAEKHADSERHHRIDLVLNPRSSAAHVTAAATPRAEGAAR